MSKSPSIGIYDWGIGGLGTYQLLRKQLPKASITYISDAGFEPYGKVEPNVLRKRVFQVMDYFQSEMGVSEIILACNAASSVLSDEELAYYPNILASGLKAIHHSDAHHIGVIGGYATIESHRFQEKALPLNKSITAVVAQVLSAHVEAGCTNPIQLELDVDAVCNQLLDCESVVLACTHYPVLLPLFQKRIPSMHWIDPAEILVNDFVNGLASNAALSNSNIQFYTSGNATQMPAVVETVYGELIELPLLFSI